MTQRNSPSAPAPTEPTVQHKRKDQPTPTTTLYNRLFKRSRTEPTSTTDVKIMSNADKADGAAAAAKKKPTLEKSRKKEIKSRLNAEAGREIRPLAVGTVAMMASALANQGELKLVLCEHQDDYDVMNLKGYINLSIMNPLNIARSPAQTPGQTTRRKNLSPNMHFFAQCLQRSRHRSHWRGHGLLPTYYHAQSGSGQYCQTITGGSLRFGLGRSGYGVVCFRFTRSRFKYRRNNHNNNNNIGQQRRW